MDATDDPSALVAAAAGGDEAAWQQLVARFSGLVWSVARGLGLRPADAEDVYQTTWYRLAEHVGRLKEPSRVGSWLAVTARNEAFKVLRAGTRLTLTDEPSPQVDEHSPETAVIEDEDAAAHRSRLQHLWSAFEQLPARCQPLLRALMATPPPSYTDVAAAFAIPVGSIGPTRARCLRHLRALLADRGISDHDGASS
ncbi:RNA polymerase sigma factor [Catellatospora sp. TT07R-123]|uniref:RNA polymerase sigma factor n=1 Tax=Catellatospora sp. TT07R-123 TaxID=2733863 RepID=UPI001B1DE73D|nr:sigma-70 family RNA polymerase sigma factor [Catellatospora sp. TT07R-123]GHJ43440.1 RNA polymerase sigma factor [Catellatospora sp. TT07R-123]